MDFSVVSNLIEISKQASKKILEVYSSDNFDVTLKGDKSPLTRADQYSNDLIVAGLEKIDATIPILSEEGGDVPYETRKSWKRYWLVDPLDGTKEFIKRTDDFTVNIALLEENKPTLGLIYVPTTGVLYYAAKGQGAFVQTSDNEAVRMNTRAPKEGSLVSYVSRTHPGKEGDALQAVDPSIKVTPMGSSLKFCKIAAGEGDIYLRLKPTMEWDSGAAQSIVEEAGGHVLQLNGEPICYNKENLMNPHFVVIGSSEFDWRRFLK